MMADKQVDALVEKTTVVDADLIPIFDSEEAGAEALKKVTLSNLALNLPISEILSVIGSGDMGGGLLIKAVVADTGVIPGGSGPFNIPVQIPSGVFIIGCQQRVNSAFHVIDNWDTDYTGGCSGQITVNGGYEKNTLMSRFYLINSTTNIPTGITDIALIKSGGGSFQDTGAIVEAIVYYLDFAALDDKA
jgi:hypothetical protein